MHPAESGPGRGGGMCPVAPHCGGRHLLPLRWVQRVPCSAVLAESWGFAGRRRGLRKVAERNTTFRAAELTAWLLEMDSEPQPFEQTCIPVALS